MREFKRDRGYITIAQRSGKTNYLRMAYALALSLKATQSEVSHLTVLVTPGTKVPKKYAAVFDEVIEIPWGDDAESFQWKIQNKWKVYHLSPYKETILLDADMIFPTDVSHWWDTLYEKDVWFTTTPMTYRGTPIVPGPYRDEFAINGLPMLYTAFMYWQHGQVADELFEMTKHVYHNWGFLRLHYKLRPSTTEDLDDMMDREGRGDSSWMRWGWTHFFKEFPKQVSGDKAFAVATKLLGAEDQFLGPGPFPTFTHMKPADQGIQSINEDWRKFLPWTLSEELMLTVGNYRQQYPFHYVEKDWLTDEVMRKLEGAARE